MSRASPRAAVPAASTRVGVSSSSRCLGVTEMREQGVGTVEMGRSQRCLGNLDPLGLGPRRQDALDRAITGIADVYGQAARQVESDITVTFGQADHTLGSTQTVQRPVFEEGEHHLED